MELTELLPIVAGLFLGITAHIVKKVIELRQTDHSFSLKKYLTENPYKTFMVVFYGVGGAAGLYMDGTLSVYTAIVTGVAANSFSGKGAG
jgi:hypothetical protein